MSVRHEALFRITAADLNGKKPAGRVSGYYGENTFSAGAMAKYISKGTFAAFKKWMSEGTIISREDADEIANAMKEVDYSSSSRISARMKELADKTLKEMDFQ